MATGGSGDVLSGLLGALLASGALPASRRRSSAPTCTDSPATWRGPPRRDGADRQPTWPRTPLRRLRQECGPLTLTVSEPGQDGVEKPDHYRHNVAWTEAVREGGIMNLLCPNCGKMLTVPEQYAGQLMKCPLCSGTFTVPALPPSGGGLDAPAPPQPAFSPGVGPRPVSAGPAGAARRAPVPAFQAAAPAPPPPRLSDPPASGGPACRHRPRSRQRRGLPPPRPDSREREDPAMGDAGGAADRLHPAILPVDRHLCGERPGDDAGAGRRGFGSCSTPKKKDRDEQDVRPVEPTDESAKRNHEQEEDKVKDHRPGVSLLLVFTCCSSCLRCSSRSPSPSCRSSRSPSPRRCSRSCPGAGPSWPDSTRSSCCFWACRSC